MCAEIVDVMLAASFSPSGNQKRFWRDPEKRESVSLCVRMKS
jgi:hypothetical protein